MIHSPSNGFLTGLLITGILAGVAPLVRWTAPAVVSPSQMSPQMVAPATGSHTDDFQRIAAPFLKTYCLRCHTGKEAEAGLDLSGFENQQQALNDLETWQSVIEAVDDQYMPPAEEPQPSSQQLNQLKDWYSRVLQAAGGGRTVVPSMRRLNQVEYENTIGDLLRIDGEVFASPSRILLVDDYFDPASHRMPRHVLAMSHFSYIQKRPPIFAGLPDVPSDPPVEHGYSNDHTALSFSPLQAERYFELADAIVNADTFPRLSGIWESLFLPRPQDELTEQQKSTARNRLQVFLSRAFRRPATTAEVDRYSQLFSQQLDRTESHEQAMKDTVIAVLVSPSFLFRQDFSANSFDEAAVDEFALANRLSYFLWASMPDDGLFQAAREGRLGTPSGLVQEVRRMMKHKRIKSLATDFGMQWLKLAGVNSARPDRDLFPEYYYSKVYTPGVSMMIEQLLYFETIMIEDRNIMEFIDSDWAYLNRHLMDWYQQDPKEVLGYTPTTEMWEDFFRIQWANKHKGGIISSGATLLSTSATTRTSPVYRGAWILDVVFNRPPPPPPANVPALEDIQDGGEKPLNVRQRLAQHRQDPTCAVCHDRIDPIGFALEKFDAIGRFRKLYPNGIKVDTRGSLFGEDFNGAAQFKAVILRNEREFVQGFTEHMLKYALGRRLNLADEKETNKIVERVITRGKHFSAVVEEIVLSDLFRKSPMFKTEQLGSQ